MQSKRLDPIPTEFTDIAQVRAKSGRAVFLGGAPSEALALVELNLSDGTRRVLRRSAAVQDGLRPYVSKPEPIAFPTGGGETAHALYYPPFSPDYAAPEGEKRAGSRAQPRRADVVRLEHAVARGAVLDEPRHRACSMSTTAAAPATAAPIGSSSNVNGASSTSRIASTARNSWSKTGHADPHRLMIAGGSAGGYTTLCALTLGATAFSGGASHYGVSDLAALARDTHKFESRYLDWLIGPYPQEERLYAERSPINHADRLSAPLIFFQGSDDKVVPPNQTELMVAALKERGIPVGYFLFDGESHGFRKAEKIKRALDAELYFFATLVLRCGLRF